MIRLLRWLFKRRNQTTHNEESRRTTSSVRADKATGKGQGGRFKSMGGPPSFKIVYFGRVVPENEDYLIVDLFEHPNTPRKVSGETKVIAYFSAHYENWRPDAKQFNLKGSRKLGKWKGERVVNWNLEENKAVILKRLDRCMDLGFWGVDLDNVDQFLYGRHKDIDGTVQWLHWFLVQCRIRGLTVGLKNAVELLPSMGQHFDFFVTEASSKRELTCYHDFGVPVVRMYYGNGARTPDFIYEVRNKVGGNRF